MLIVAEKREGEAASLPHQTKKKVIKGEYQATRWTTGGKSATGSLK